jgi:hypothetical protein
MTDFEREDLELKAMMGDRFIDETVPVAETTTVPKEEKKCREANVAEKPSKAADADWHPTKQRTFMDDLKDCTKSTMIFGGLNVLIWYWEMAGLMDESIALPSMIACAVLAGIGVGKVLGVKR